MIRQTSETQPKRGVADSLGDIIGDVATLAELQLDLFKLDCRESGRRILTPAIAVAAGALLFVGAVPIMLLAVTAMIYELGGLSLTASLMIALLAGLSIATLTLLVGIRGLSGALRYYDRSTQELSRNVSWLKNLKHRNKRFSP